jgi:hypothetical protein
MNLDWQTATVLAAVGGAAVYLLRAVWQSVARQRAAACGGCNNCAAGADGQPKVIEIESLVSGIKMPEAAAAESRVRG